MKTSTRFQPWQPDRPSFLPPNLREWLSEDHWVCFLLDRVNELDFAAVAAAYASRPSRR